MKNNPFDSSDSESSPDQEKVRYKTRSLARRTGAADDTGNDYDEDLPSEISGLDSSFTAKHYLSVNLRDMARNYDVSKFFLGCLFCMLYLVTSIPRSYFILIFVLRSS